MGDHAPMLYTVLQPRLNYTLEQAMAVNFSITSLTLRDL